jgi:phytanoyl-CoA hydroxylase
MLGKVEEQLRYRLAMRSLVAPAEPPEGYYSRFGGLWTDRLDASQEIARRLESGAISELDAERLRGWIAHGYVIIEQAVKPELCDRVRADLDAAFAQGDERLLMHSPANPDYQPLKAGVDAHRARVVDAYAFYQSACEALFSEAIVGFMRSIFEDDPLLFQSLTFENGSEQPLHQDSAFVVTTSPLEFAASWIALEDIRPGSGELTYIDGSHRLPEYLFSGKYKHWNAKRDGGQQHDEWHDLILAHAEQQALEEKTFLARKGDVLIWSADLAHGGSPVSDPAMTRKSLVGHYCPNRVEPIYFKLQPDRRTKRAFNGGFYASAYYPLGE